MKFRFVSVWCAVVALAVAMSPAAVRMFAQSTPSGKMSMSGQTTAPPKGKSAQSKKGAGDQTQKQDEEYTKLIKEYLQDPRITTELVDHMPASDTVPSPLKFLGRIPGKPGELTYSEDINKYYKELAKDSPRAKYITVGKSEEGREISLLIIADEATIKNIDKYKDMLGQLTDPRKTTEAQAQELLKTAKPIYYVVSGMHSPETGGPEMLIELAYRLIIEETPFIQNIRNNVITMITPVIETDGRDAEVDTYYFNKKRRAAGETGTLPLMYWGKYVQHDNNRDGMGQLLELTKTITKNDLEWHPTILHDLHEAQTYLYASTGTGPYNDELDPITIDEWWLMAENDVLEMAKRGVPGVWTYGFYDGWVPNYMFFIAHEHNAVGRFYEVQSYLTNDPNDTASSGIGTVTAGATTTSREWFRPNPPLPSIKWGPRNNTNIQESALLFALNNVARNKEMFLSNYWVKNKRAVEKGKNGPVFGWVIPANQQRKSDAADAVNDLRHQGLEVSTAKSAFKAGNLNVEAGDYVVRGDQPFRTLADMYFAVQNYAPQNPSPYDDTGWTFQYMRDIRLVPVTDRGLLDQPMSLITADVTAPGGIEGSGPVVVVAATGDNNMITFRFKNADVKMQAAEDDFDLGGHHFRAGSVIVPNADAAKLGPMLKQLGLSAWAVDAAPKVATHELVIPRIGYVHSWSRTQDEGWVRASLDAYGVPYTYFSELKLKDGNLRTKYDVIIFPHVGGNSISQVNGTPMTGSPIPYKKTADTPNLGFVDQTDDIRGGMGIEGLVELSKFVEQGGTLITEGSTTTIFPDYGITTGVTVEHPTGLFVRGSILRAHFADAKSPIAYGFGGGDLPVYFNQDPVLNVAAGGFGGRGGGGGGRGGAGGAGINGGEGQNVTPNAIPLHISPWQEDEAGGPPAAAEAGADGAPAGGRGGRGGRGGGRGGAGGGAGAGAGGAGGGAGQGGFGGRGGGAAGATPRVVLTFASNPDDMLLSGTLVGGQLLANRAAAVDVPLGKGHVVMFALRPFWRWQSQGTYSLGFNAIMNWNALDAGRPAAGGGRGAAAPGQEQ